MKEVDSKSADLQNQLEKARQQHQETQNLQQTTTGKLREAQVLVDVGLSSKIWDLQQVMCVEL